MRVQTEEWRRFIPGVRMYKGKKTCFYNGEELWDENGEPLVYDWAERDSWEVIIVLPGVEVIPRVTFKYCQRITTVIMADSVQRIEMGAFLCCFSLVNVSLSRNLEYIGERAFSNCKSLPSIFIPPSCREIDDYVFYGCYKLIIFHVPQHTEVGDDVIKDTALIDECPFYENEYNYNIEEVNTWIKNINRNEEYEFHRACSSFNPMEDIVYGIVRRRGLGNFQVPNALGITPARYLKANPYADIDQHKLMKRYIAEMMGETI